MSAAGDRRDGPAARARGERRHTKSREPLALDADEGAQRWALETRRATIRLARRLAAKLQRGDLVVLTGELGVGKTFFVRAMCRALGVPREVRVTSPSFALVNELEGVVRDEPTTIVHADLYRLGDPEEVVHLGLLERRDDVLMLVEWGERFVDELGGDAMQLSLSLSGDRRIAHWAAIKR